jgi:hypothetical protein
MADYSLLTAVDLVFDPDGPALICKVCQYTLAVSRSQVTSHLWNKHQICPESRQDITPLIRSLKIPNSTNIRLRPDKSLVHPHLEVYRGYACLTCKYRTISLEMMTRHVSPCCPPPRALSTRRRNPDDPYQDVQLQTWATGASRRYWIVRGALTHGPLRIFSGSSHLEATGNPKRAQRSHKSYKLHGTIADPWAISDHKIGKANEDTGRMVEAVIKESKMPSLKRIRHFWGRRLDLRSQGGGWP